MTGNPLSGHTKANESTMAGTAKFTDGLTDGEHIQSPTLTNYLEGIHGNGILLEEDTAYGATNKNVPEDLPGVVEQNTNSDRIRVTGGTAIIDGVPYEFANGPGGTLDIDLISTSPNRRASYGTALTAGQEALIVVYVSTKDTESSSAVRNVQWELGTPITTATNAYPITPSAFLSDPKAADGLATNSKSFQSVVLAVLRVVYNASAPGDLKISVTEINDKRIFIRPSPIYFAPVTSGAVGAANAPVDSAAEIDALVTGTTGDLAGSRLGALWQSHGTQLGSTTAPDNEKDTLYYSGKHAARYTRSVFDRVLTSTATSITLKSTDANILLLTPGGSATVTTSGSFPAGYIIELRNLHASNAVVFTRASNYSVAGGTLTRFVCTTSHATTPVFSVLSDDSIETIQLADNAVTLAKLDGIPRGKIIVGDASGDPSHLAAGSNGKLLVADANGDPSWTTVSGDASISAGAITIANDAVTYAKMQDVSATDRLLGRDSAGSGVVEEITPANVRTMLNVADGATAYTDADAIAAVEGESTLVLQSGVTVGTDLKMTTSSDNVIIENVTQDKDIIFQVNDGGSASTEVMRIDGSLSKVGIGTGNTISANLHIQSATGTSDTTPMVLVESTDTGSATGPELVLYRNSSSAADTDALGHLLYRGKNDAGTPGDVTYAQVYAKIGDKSNGAEFGELYLRSIMGGTLRNRVELNATEVVINNGSIDSDFRVESDGDTHAIFVNGQNDRVGIGTNAPATKLDVSGDTTISRSADLGQTRTLSVEGARNATGTDYARLDLKNYDSNSGSPATYVGARIAAINEVTGVDDGSLAISTADAGTLAERMRITDTGDVGIGTSTPASIVEIQDGLTTTGAVLTLSTKETTVVANDVLGKIDFKAPLEASGTDAILPGASITALASDTFAADNNETDLVFATASSDAELGSATSGATFERMRITSAGDVGIGLDDPAGKLHVKTTGVNYAALFETTDDGTSAAPDVALYRNSATPANGDDLGHLIWRGVEDAGGGSLVRGNYADIFAEIQVATSGSESGKLHLRTKKAGTMNKVISLTATEVVINEDGNSGNKDIDFRIESTGNDNMIFVDSANDEVGIGTNAPVATLDVASGGTFRNTRLLTVSVSASTTLTEAAHAGRYNICAGNITLPSTSTAGEHYAILNTTGGNITIGRNGRNINGAGSDFTLGTFKAATCIAIGSNNWMVVG